jgi:hypothetical protein
MDENTIKQAEEMMKGMWSALGVNAGPDGNPMPGPQGAAGADPFSALFAQMGQEMGTQNQQAKKEEKEDEK